MLTTTEMKDHTPKATPSPDMGSSDLGLTTVKPRATPRIAMIIDSAIAVTTPARTPLHDDQPKTHTVCSVTIKNLPDFIIPSIPCDRAD